MSDLLTSIIENKSIQLFNISLDRAEFERFRNLINGSLKSKLEEKLINNTLLKNTTESFKSEKTVFILHDPSEIRKKTQ